MNTNREKTSNVMGLVVSFLLHAIFIAGCFALDASSTISSTAQQDQTTQTNSVADQQQTRKPNS